MEEVQIFDKEFVGNLIPQKFPFVMVDRLYSFSDISIVSGFRIEDSNIFFSDGQFSEPGLIEHMAQSVALHTGYQFYLRKEQAPTGYIGAISSINIENLPRLHDEIITTVNILHEFAGVTLVEISTSLNDEIIAHGQMKTVLAS